MPILLLLIAVVAYVLFSRSREIFVLRLRSRKLTCHRGRVPSGLLSSFREVLDGAQNGTIKASRTPNGAHLRTSGISSSAEQRMRNILGLYPISKLSAPRHRTALAMQEALSPLNVAWKERGLPEIRIGIGINTGPMSVSNMGSQRRFDCAVMGWATQ
ncbi:MAG: DUF3634 family protein [Myxococcales bacterium]|nr:DUF3634 family protein [Myxococcales bacterium]